MEETVLKGNIFVKNVKKYGWIACLFFVAVLIALFAYGASPFFPMNEWSDPNCFLTVGRAILNGKVMYRDIYEQKGPYVYFIHAFAALISDTSFLGIWIFEIIILFFSMFLIVKIVGLYGYKKRICFWTAIFLMISVCFSYAMSTGDSVEEFSAVFYLWLLYITIKNIKEEQEYTPLQYIFIGGMAGIVFWSKFTLVGIYVGWFAYFLWRCIRNKKGREIGRAILWIALGVLATTLPCLIYFLATGAVEDWLQVYLYDNLFLYSAEGGIFKSLFLILLTLVRNPQYNVFTIFGAIWFALKKKGEERWVLTWMLSIMALALFIGGKGYRYYGLPFYVFAIFGYISAIEWIDGRGAKFLKPLGAVCGAILLAVSTCFFFSNGHHHHIFMDREDLAQYKVAAYMQEHGDGDVTLLHYGGLDNGFYLAADVIPHLRYFSQLNIQSEDMYAEMKRYLDEGLTDFVVYRLDRCVQEPLMHERYQEVLRLSEWSREERVIYILYQLKE